MSIYEEMGQYNLLDKLFDFYRVVDPIKKKVCSNKEDSNIVTDHDCFEFWGNGKSCDNCITMRAYNEERTFTKIEIKDNKVYFIMASSIKENKSTYLLEAIKDITKDHVCENEKNLEYMKEKIYKLNKILIEDELTNCYNRRYINEMLPVNIEKSRSQENNLCVCMVDIDYFKDVNDKYGHLCGDYILKEFASLLKSKINNEQNWLARYGGEEFLIVFNNLNKNEILEQLESMRDAIENHCFKWENKSINITASFGAVLVDEENTSDIISKADKNLYKAKRIGRNKIVI